MKTQKVRVVRAFYWKGEPTKVGDVVEVPEVFAAELVAAKKAERVAEQAPAPVEPTKAKGKE